MKTISHLYGAVIRFVTLDEILPENKSSMPMFADAIQSQYKFKSAGESPAAAASGLLSSAFQNGVINLNDDDVPIIGLDFQGSRIQMMCTKTEQATAALDEIIAFLVKNFGFRLPPRSVYDLPSSAIIVDFGPEFLKKLDVMAKLTQHVMGALKTSGVEADLRPQSLKLAGKTSLASAFGMNINYVLEERSGRPTGTDWLFSNAPLSSEAHIAMLQDLETALLDGV